MDELPFIHLNEEHFRLAMFEQLNGRIRYDPDRLASLRFKPLLIYLKPIKNLAFVAIMILMLISSRS